MEMLARGMTNREIAHHFDMSIKTVNMYRNQDYVAKCALLHTIIPRACHIRSLTGFK